MIAPCFRLKVDVTLDRRRRELSPRPGRVLKVFDVPLPFPREPAMRTGSVAAELRSQIWALVREGGA